MEGFAKKQALNKPVIALLAGSLLWTDVSLKAWAVEEPEAPFPSLLMETHPDRLPQQDEETNNQTDGEDFQPVKPPAASDMPSAPQEQRVGEAEASPASEPGAEKAKQSGPTEEEPALNSEIQQVIDRLDSTTRAELNRLSEALNWEARAVNNELRDDEEVVIKDIGMLWQAAVGRSGSIRYAIEKLSRRDATGEPVGQDGFGKRLLQNVARLGGVAGSMWTGTPAGLIGGNMVGGLLESDPLDPSAFPVTDADMVILAREVEELQSRVIELYYGYRHAMEAWKLSQEASQTLVHYHDRSQKHGAPDRDPIMQTVMSSLLESAQQSEAKAKQDYLSARNALGLVVGPEALAALEQTEANSQKKATSQ